jgi:hypothetical protein
MISGFASSFLKLRPIRGTTDLRVRGVLAALQQFLTKLGLFD